jgi:hypothetical protein
MSPHHRARRLRDHADEHTQRRTAPPLEIPGALWERFDTDRGEVI